MTEHRKLATIIFADIDGYTALMQSDESLALTLLGQFKSTLERETPVHDGQIIQYFGDGCLLAFESSTKAVNCAIAMQKGFSRNNGVPVRIGLHLGEILYKEGNIFGDGVNIASRIESLGIPGSILMSRTVRQQIKNKADFLLLSLGAFDFKNVDEPMEVFALANPGFVVPKRSEMQGKLKVAPRAEGRKRNLLLPVILALAVIAVLAIWLITENGGSGTSTVSDDLNAITIFPFDVKGNDDILYLGEGMVDLLSTKLDGIPGINPVDPNLIFSKLTPDKVISRQPDEAAALSTGFGASQFILGSITQVNDILQISASKYNSAGDLIAKKSVEGSKANIAASIDQLTKELVAEDLIEEGYELNSLAALTSENLPALTEYLLGEQVFRNGKIVEAYNHYIKATELDSTFAMAWLRLRDAASWSLRTPVPHALDMANKYAHKMPQKWREYLDAIKMFEIAHPYTELAFKNLIEKYGETREFNSGVGENLFHYNPTHGRSISEAKPWFTKSRSIDPNNLEALIHLMDIAWAEGDTSLMKSIIADLDPDADFWPRIQIRYLSTLDTVVEEQFPALFNHTDPVSMGLDIFMSAPEDPIGFLELSERIAKATGMEDQIERPQVNLNALQGKESKWFSIWFERSDSDRFRQYFHALPATLMVPDKYHPLSDHYETLYETTEQHDVPYAIYASAKYCRALGLDQECLRCEQQLLDKAIDDPDYEAARYFYHSLKAFDAWIEGDHTTTLAFIDSAYQYFPGFWESQVACLDKTFMLADIYEQQGEYTRSIAYLENIPAVQGYGLSKGYATYRLTQLYELTEEHGKAIAKCNWLIKNYKDCDEVYRPWVEEVTARRDRLMKRIL